MCFDSCGFALPVCSNLDALTGYDEHTRTTPSTSIVVLCSKPILQIGSSHSGWHYSTGTLNGLLVEVLNASWPAAGPRERYYLNTRPGLQLNSDSDIVTSSNILVGFTEQYSFYPQLLVAKQYCSRGSQGSTSSVHWHLVTRSYLMR
jgi:hypothetical protein